MVAIPTGDMSVMKVAKIASKTPRSGEISIFTPIIDASREDCPDDYFGLMT
jgi:hypothetical protein